jgi:hypothetical protein
MFSCSRAGPAVIIALIEGITSMFRIAVLASCNAENTGPSGNLFSQNLMYRSTVSGQVSRRFSSSSHRAYLLRWMKV